MAKAKQLTRRQYALMADLFASDKEEQAVLDGHNISRRLYFKWLADEAFAEQLDQQIKVAYRRSKMLIARQAPTVASTLVGLTKCEKEETARKACLDIICPDSAIHSAQTSTAPPEDKAPESEQISPQTASRLLAAMAEADSDL